MISNKSAIVQYNSDSFCTMAYPMKWSALRIVFIPEQSPVRSKQEAAIKVNRTPGVRHSLVLSSLYEITRALESIYLYENKDFHLSELEYLILTGKR